MASYWKALWLLFSLPLGASLSALAAAGLQNRAIVSPLQVSCTAKTGPLKEPFTASIGSWLGERGTGTQWLPSLDTQKMEMSYLGAALVSLIAMSGWGDEGRGEKMGCHPLCIKGVVLCLRLQWKCSIWIFKNVGNEGDTSLPLPSPISSHPRSWKLLLPRFNSSPWCQERMHLPLLCHTSFFWCLLFNFYE